MPIEEINCGDPWNLTHCIECCNWPSPTCDEHANTCCPFADSKQCPIVNNPPKTSVVLAVGSVQLTFESATQGKGGSGQQFHITLEAVSRSKIAKQQGGAPKLKIKTRLTGADASVGSLLYPVALLGLGTDPLDALHAQGYDVSIKGKAPSNSCPAIFSSQFCTALANQLAQGIAASLVQGDPAARAAFIQGVQGLGFAPCQVIP